MGQAKKSREETASKSTKMKFLAFLLCFGLIPAVFCESVKDNKDAKEALPQAEQQDKSNVKDRLKNLVKNSKRAKRYNSYSTSGNTDWTNYYTTPSYGGSSSRCGYSGCFCSTSSDCSGSLVCRWNRCR